MRTLLILASAFTLAACDSNAPLEKAVAAAVAREAEASQECESAKSASYDNQSKLASARQNLSSMQAEKDFEEIVATGDAGTSETLRLMRQKMDNPYREQERDRLMEASKAQQSGAELSAGQYTLEAKRACLRLDKASAETQRAKAALLQATQRNCPPPRQNQCE